MKMKFRILIIGLCCFVLFSSTSAKDDVKYSASHGAQNVNEKSIWRKVKGGVELLDVNKGVVLSRIDGEVFLPREAATLVMSDPIKGKTETKICLLMGGKRVFVGIQKGVSWHAVSRGSPLVNVAKKIRIIDQRGK